MSSPLSIDSNAGLVGREREWQSLQERCHRARNGAGGITWIAGEVGIGKTALMSKLQIWANGERYRTLWGRHIGHRQAPPLHGLREALMPLFDIRSSDGPRAIESKVSQQLARSWPDLALHSRLLIHFLEPLVTEESRALVGEVAPQPLHLHHLFFRLLATVAQDQPLLLFLDDFHWADATTLDYLQYLLPLLCDQPVLFVISYRPEDAGDSPIFKTLCLAPNSDVLHLPRLQLKSTALWVERAGLATDDVFCKKLHQLTEGVPLFIELWLVEIAKAEYPPEHLPTRLPESISQTIDRRLQSLPHNLQSLLQAAAVVGDRFSAELLQRIDGRPLTEILDQLADLEEHYRLLQSDLSTAQERPYAFSHLLIRQVIYDTLPLGRRQQLHARAGAAIEEQIPLQPDLVFEVGHHYIAAHRGEQAAAILYQAGRRAHALGSPRDACSYYEQALGALGDRVSQHRAAIQESLGDATFAIDDRPQARELWEAALALQPDALARAMLYLKLGQSWRHSDFSRQWRYLQQGLRETQDYPNSVERAQILGGLMLTTDPAQPGSAADKKRIATQAATALRILRHHPRRDVLARMLTHQMAMVFVFLGDHRNANSARKNRLYSRAIHLAESLDDWELVIEGRMKQAEVWHSIDLQKTLALAEAALALAERYLTPQHQRIAHMLTRILHISLAAGDQRRINQYAPRLATNPEGPLPNLEPYQWQTHPQEAWDFHMRQVDLICRRFVVVVRLVKHLTRLQRLAHKHLGQDLWRDAVRRLPQDYPGYFANLPPIEWEFHPVASSAIADIAGKPLGLEALNWQDAARNSRHQFLKDGVVEITPGIGVGLGWGRTAPCMLRRVAGDFKFVVRIYADSHPLCAGGLVVWDQEGNLVRFGRGIDHESQISLAWHDGQQLLYAGASYLAERDVYLCLARSGRQYAGYISTDGENWSTCGALRFGDEGPVEAGIFAELSYEYDIPQPFPICFGEIRLWVAPSAKIAEQPTRTPVQNDLYPLPAPPKPFYGMVGYHRTFEQFRQQLEAVAHSSLPLLIVGDSGTGKELAAQAVHLMSQQGEGPYIPLNVAALPEALVESELFGHLRGSFTGATRDQPGLFAAATGGSIFLDEIGELPLEIQARLLRVLDSGEIRPLGSSRIIHVNARVIAATNRDLGREVGAGNFRQDLYFRFADPLIIPPLRQRREDIPHLVAFFLALYGQGARYRITHAAMRQLEDHPWPDNIRGLKHVLERAVLSATKARIDVEHLSLRSTVVAPAAREDIATTHQHTGRRPMPMADELQQISSHYQGNIAAISRHYNVSRLTIYRWFERCKLDREKLRHRP